MIALIGFWTALTVLIIATLLPIVCWSWPALTSVVASSIPNKRDAADVKDFLFTTGTRSTVILGKRFKVDSMILMFPVPVGALIIDLTGAGLYLDYYQGTPFSIVSMYSLMAEVATPFASYMGIIFLGVLALRVVVKYLYLAFKFKEKVEAHVGNKEIHN